MNKKKSQEGFTLIELLISLAILGVVLAAVVYVYTNTATAAASLQTRNDLLPEMQIAQNYMASKLKEASYVFQDGANIQMSVSGATTVKPSGGSAGSVYNWVVGTDPIVAFILPPKTVLPGRCNTEGTATPKGEVAKYCYAFYAFYAMKRDAFLAAVTGADKPNVDSANDATSWVLLEYRGYYDSAILNVSSGYLWQAASLPAGNTGQLLMDYLPAQYTSTNKLFSMVGTTGNFNTEIPGSTTVTIKLAAQQIVAGQTVRLPSSITTNFTPLTVYPRNVGKPMLNN